MNGNAKYLFRLIRPAGRAVILDSTGHPLGAQPGADPHQEDRPCRNTDPLRNHGLLIVCNPRRSPDYMAQEKIYRHIHPWRCYAHLRPGEFADVAKDYSFVTDDLLLARTAKRFRANSTSIHLCIPRLRKEGRSFTNWPLAGKRGETRGPQDPHQEFEITQVNLPWYISGLCVQPEPI